MNPSAVTKFIGDLRPAFEFGDPQVARKAAEAECIAVVEAAYRAVAAGTFGDVMADDVVLEILGPAGVPFVGRWQGRDNVVTAVRQNFALMQDQRPEVVKVVAQGDTVMVLARERGRFRPTGREYDAHFVHIFTCRNGRVTHIQQMFDTAPLLAAAAGWTPDAPGSVR